MEWKIILCLSLLTTPSVYVRMSGAGPGNPPSPGTLFLAPERIPLAEGGCFHAERGMMFVNENRSEPKNVIALEIYRFGRSDQADPDAAPIFYLHGGPSFGGLERQLERPGNFEKWWRPLLDVSDVVVVSQRGIGPSRPKTLVEQTLEPRPLDRPYEEQAAVREFQDLILRERQAWEHLGVDLRGYTVLEMAADVDEVREALGYEKIVLWGGSFGSHWIMAIQRTYPETVARAVLFGMEGPDHTYDHPGHYWNVYRRVAAEAESSPEFEGLIPEGGLLEAVHTVIRRASEDPFHVTVTDSTGTHRVLFDGTSIRDFSDGYSGGLPGWPADVIRMYRGDFQEAAESAVRRHGSAGRSFRTASYWMLDCGSGITARRLAAYESDPAQKIVGSTYWEYTAGCPVWDSDLGDEFRADFETEIPTVIVHGTWDTSTPYENALELIPMFKNGKLIPLKRGPHGAIRAAMEVSEAFRDGILTFAATGDMSGLPDELEMPAVEWIVPGGDDR